MARFENLNVNKLNVTKVLTGVGSATQAGFMPFLLQGSNTNISAAGSTDAVTTAALTIPANTLVLSVYNTVVTSANATCSATLGDGTTADGWDASVDMKVAANTRTCTVPGTDTYGVGKLYATSDTIDATFTFSTTTTTGVFRLDALCVKM